MLVRNIGLILCATFLVACSSLPRSSEVPASAVTNAPVENLATKERLWKSETLTGRFSVQYVAQGQNQSLYGKFIWERPQETVSQVSLISPFGQTLAMIEISPEQAKLSLPNQAPRTALNADEMVENALGFPLPVAGLADWLYARPATHSTASISRGENNRPTLLTQDNWQLSYQSYYDTPRLNGLAVKRLDLKRELAGDPIEIRLVLDEPPAP